MSNDRNGRYLFIVSRLDVQLHLSSSSSNKRWFMVSPLKLQTNTETIANSDRARNPTQIDSWKRLANKMKKKNQRQIQESNARLIRHIHTETAKFRFLSSLQFMQQWKRNRSRFVSLIFRMIRQSGHNRIRLALGRRYSWWEGTQKFRCDFQPIERHEFAWFSAIARDAK